MPRSGRLLRTKAGYQWYQKLVVVGRNWSLRLFYRVDQDSVWLALIMPSWQEVPVDQLG